METQLCLIFCTHWAHLAKHFIERSPTPSRAFASETSSRTSCRFDTSSPVPRWCVPRPILVLLAHRRPPRSLLPPADYSPTSPPDQAAGAYYAPAAYKVYEAESAVTAAETALSALNARIKSVRRDPDPTPSALGQISSILPTVPRGAQYCLLPTVQPADTRRVHPNPSPTHNRSTTPTSRAPRRP